MIAKHLACLLAHRLRRALDQHVVRIDGAVEENLARRNGLERGKVHAAATGLDGVQAVESGRDHRGDQRLEAAAAMQLDLQP